MADLGKCWNRSNSFQTPWISSYNACKCISNYFRQLLVKISGEFDNFGEDFGWIPKGPKSADFDQKAWAIAHGFENGGFG